MEQSDFLVGLNNTLAPENLVDVDTEGNVIKTPEEITEDAKSKHTLEDRDFIAQAAADAFKGDDPDELEGGLKADPRYGTTLRNISYEDYDDYIDRPFSFIADDADDLRAYGQSTGEKWAHGIPKLVGKTGTNILGSTIGLLYGGAAWGYNLFTDKSATKAFFDNDFQRGLDGINEWMDDKLPNYYTKEEQEYNILQSLGTANFWANDFTQGLSFVAGAVLSEGLTAGLATGSIAAKATKIMKGAVGQKGAKYMQTGATDEVLKALGTGVDANRMKTGLRTMRQLGTGAMYEAGVEARHHYDTTMQTLQKAFKDEHGRGPTKEEYAGLADIATKSANAVFAGNVALVGYGNYMMFPKIFGKGLKSTKSTLANSIRSEVTDKGRAYHLLAKEIGKKEAIGRNLWRVFKTPLYEGFVEEGGQKLLDLAGQGAAENFYLSKSDPGYIEMVADLLMQTQDNFGKVYGSKEGHKEIGIGFLLAAMGLPGRARTKTKDGKSKTSLGWNGGIWGTLQDHKLQKETIKNLKTHLENNPTAMKAFERQFTAMVRNGVIQDAKDYAMIIDSPFAYKNAEHDETFNYIASRIRAGFESELYEDVKHIREMSLDEFREAFNYTGISDLNDTELQKRREGIADMFEKRIQAIKDAFNKIDQSFTSWGEDQRNTIAHALSVSKDSINREEEINARLAEIGLNLDLEVEEDKAKADEREANAAKLRLKNIWNRISSKKKKEILEENSDVVETVKRKLNIKELTDPTHLEEFHRTLAEQQLSLGTQITAIEDNTNLSTKEKEAQLKPLQEKLNTVLDRAKKLAKALDEGLDPYLSANEQKMLDEFEKSNPEKFAENGAEARQLLKDSRKLRARRHRAIDMYNQLLELREEGTWSKKGDLVPRPEVLHQAAILEATSPNVSVDNPELARLITMYQGKIIEMDYKSSKDGKVRKYRYYVENTQVTSSSDPILTRIPSYETIAILNNLDNLNAQLETLQKNPEIAEIEETKIEALKTQIKEINETLNSRDHVSKPSSHEAKMLLEAENGISIVDSTKMAQELLESTIDQVDSQLKNKSELVTNSIKLLKEQLREAKIGLKAFNKELEAAKNISTEEYAKKQSEVLGSVIKLEKLVRGLEAEIKSQKQILTLVEADLGILQDFSSSTKNVVNEAQVNDLIKNLFEDSYTLKSYGKVYKQMLQNPIFNMVQIKKGDKTFLDVNKLNTFRNIVAENGEEAKKLLQEYDKNVTGLLNKIERLKKQVEKLKELIKVTKPTEEDPYGRPYARADKKISKRFVRATNNLMAAEKDLLDVEEQFLKDLTSITEDSNKITNVAVGLSNALHATRKKIDFFINPPLEESQEGYIDSNETQMSLDDIANAVTDDVDAYNSPSIGRHKLGKTAGSHGYAIRRLKEINEDIAFNLTVSSKTLEEKVYKLEKQQLEDQLRFFAFTGANNFNDSAVKKKYTFLAVNRNTVPSAILDDIIFYDETKPIEKRWFKATSKKEKLNKTPNRETLVYVLANSKGEVELVGGKPIYTSVPTTDLYNEIEGQRVYRYGKADLQVEGRKEFYIGPKKYYDGEITETTKETVAAFATQREQILESEEPLVVSITGMGNPMINKIVDEQLVRPSRSISKDTHNIALRPNVSTDNKATVGGRTVKLSSGMLYLEKDGKLVPVSHNRLTETDQNTVYNLLVKLARQESKRINKEYTPAQSKLIDPNDLESKTIYQILSDMVFFGPNTNRDIKAGEEAIKAPRFEIRPYRDGFTLHFGKIGEIDLGQLLDAETNDVLHRRLKEFIKGLKYNTNYFVLGKDVEQREGGQAYKTWKKKKADKEKELRKKKKKGQLKGTVANAMRTWLKDNESPLKQEPIYEPFYEFTVDNDGEVVKTEWRNYTDYLLGDGPVSGKKQRTTNEIPLFTLMRPIIEAADPNYGEGAQFLNTYVTLDTHKMVALSAFKKAKEKEETTSTTTKTVVATKAQTKAQKKVVEESAPWMVNATGQKLQTTEVFDVLSTETKSTFTISFKFDEIGMISKVTISNLKDKDGKKMKVPKKFKELLTEHFTRIDTDREALSIAFTQLVDADLAFTWVNPLGLKPASTAAANTASTNKLPTELSGGNSSKTTNKNNKEC